MASMPKSRGLVSTALSPKGATAQPKPLARTTSLASAVSASARQEDYVDTDDLFTKHTVAEIRAVQRRLRVDADGKQEELRLMVGERYRDLLQASASIVSIAQSSANVLDALEDMKVVVCDRSQLRPHKRTGPSNQDDRRLHSLQSLAAHVKLLLDTPEHLWRLLERKKYLHAAWLFLLARVVHRSLASEDIDDDEGWQSQGIDILDQFPLAQKQWDTISHFRPQITHKATLYLRETGLSTEDVCATLLTLHLIDSRPLTETLSVFIAQRSKALDILLNRKSDQATTRKAVGEQDTGMASAKARPKTRKTIAREVWQAVEAVLNAIAGTMGAARDIFQEHGTERQSLIHRVLDYVIKDETSAYAHTLPSELRLSTQHFLTALPSSSHFLLLPAGLREYKPYVDLSSSSTTVAQPDLARKLGDWFRSSTQLLKSAFEGWFEEVASIRQVWAVRRWAREGLGGSPKLNDEEKAHITTALDNICHKRIITIYTSALEQMERSFRTALTLATTSMLETDKLGASDMSPVQHLLKYSSQALPIFGSNDAVSTAAFDQLASQLQSQLIARTPLLDQVLSPLESQTQQLKRDLRFIDTNKDDTTSLGAEILGSYSPDAEAFCARLSAALEFETEQALHTSSDTFMAIIVFIGRVADELASYSDFASTIGMSQRAEGVFRDSARHLHNRTIERWRNHTISAIIKEYRRTFELAAIGSSIFPAQDSSDISRPSTPLMHGLHSLTLALQELGLHREVSQRRSIAESTVRQLITKLLDFDDDGAPLPQGRQALADLYFIRNLAAQWAPALEETRKTMDDSIVTLRQQLAADRDARLPREEESADHFSRSQLIIDTLLPPRSSNTSGTSMAATPLLRLGAPSSEQQFLPAMDLVKPSSRFGLLMSDTGL